MFTILIFFDGQKVEILKCSWGNRTFDVFCYKNGFCIGRMEKQKLICQKL